MEFAGYKGRVWVNQPKKGYCTDFTSADVQRLKSESSRIIAGSNTEARIAALKAPADLTAAADSSRRRALKDRRQSNEKAARTDGCLAAWLRLEVRGGNEYV
jgi:hypothetical protein